MPLLAYCILKDDAGIEIPATGVENSPIATVEGQGLRCLVSEYAHKSATDTFAAKTSALAFNRVLQDILRQAGLIPFRFPTILDSRAEILNHLRERADYYRQALDRLGDGVQMEVRLAIPEEPKGASGRELSGADYLHRRQAARRTLAQTGERMRDRLSALIRDWRQRDTPAGLRCYALVARSQVPGFLSLAREMQIPPQTTARVSGPWPATEFMENQ